MQVTKRHKIYYRHKNGSARRLDKVAGDLYIFLLEYFIEKGGNAKYVELNKDVTHWKHWKGLDISIPLDLEDQFKVICPSLPFITVYYNGSWRPLAKLILKVKFKTDKNETKSLGS